MHRHLPLTPPLLKLPQLGALFTLVEEGRVPLPIKSARWKGTHHFCLQAVDWNAPRGPGQPKVRKDNPSWQARRPEAVIWTSLMNSADDNCILTQI